MNTKKLKKNPILSILNGPLNFIAHPASKNIGFKNPDGVGSTSENYVWEVDEVKKFLKENMPEFRKNVFTPATSFIQAVKQSKNALESAFSKEPDYMFSNIKYTTGVIIADESATFFKINKEERLLTAVAFVEDVLAGGYKDIALHIDAINAGKHQVYIPAVLVNHPEGKETISDIRRTVDSAAMITIFRTFADHEIKLVCGKTTAKLNNVTYNNPNKQDIHVIDSSWYTSLVRTEGFMVSGHLRMQACGKNFSDRKLIYIDSFEKHGYVRKAKMLPTDVLSVSEVSEL